MGCSSCNSAKDGKPGGCRSNGTCGTGGCNKLNVQNWLSNMQTPSGHSLFNIVEVRFKGSRKEFFKNVENLQLQTGDVVAVEASPGHDIGVVSLSGELVRLQLKKKGLSPDSSEIKTIYRKARQTDIEKWHSAKDLEIKTMYRSRIIADQLGLAMKLSDVEYQGDMKKATFYYTADTRVDFRELIKRLADEFRVRVEMRQIGVRQEAGRLGGIGSCGRELCCSTWLTDFRSVSTSAARYQNLSLNPQKLAGQCGKLKCCLNYELDSYLDALKDFPETSISLETQRGRAFHRKTDIFKRLMWYAYSNKDTQQAEVLEVDSENWVMIGVDRVNEIIHQNKQKIRPAELTEKLHFAATEKEPDYENIVGQDSLTRMDKKKPPHHKRRNPKRLNSGNRNRGNSNIQSS